MSVNDSLTVTGSYINQGEVTEGFFRNVEGDITTFTVPGSTLTSLVAINSADEIAGNSIEVPISTALRAIRTGPLPSLTRAYPFSVHGH
jgi:hypothetical protein